LATNNQDEPRLALFIDFENIAIGVRDAHYRKFDVNLVLERLLDKGKLLVKKAYADWSRYSDYKRSFHEAAIELIEVPQKSVGGKNSADIRLVVDAMDMSFQKEHINCFVVASGDSDFSPLVSKLKENNKYVIGLGVKNSTSDLLIENCDEFIFYEDLVRGQQRPMPVIGNLPEKVQECFGLLVDSVLALQRENKEVLWGSMVKETMKRKKPSFNETYYGFRTFSHLLEDAQRRGIVVLRRDQKSGSYIVEDLGAASSAAVSVRTESTVQPAAPAQPPSPPHPAASAPRPVEAPSPPPIPAPTAAPLEASEANGSRGRRRRGRGRRGRGAPHVTGASPELSAHAASDESEAHEPDELDEPVEHEETANAGPAEYPPHETAAAVAGEPEGPTPEVSSASAPGSPLAAPERPGFSLFSWIRRDPSPPAREPQATPGKPDSGE
jgi:uncharacterized LabA/DUF88 family protein